MRRGVFVHGNHLGYSRNLTLNESIALLKKTFPKNDPIQYLNNTSYEYKGIIFLGCCLYTNFKLYGEDRQDIAMISAARGMNDFIYPRYEDKDGTIRTLTTDDYLELFEKSRLFLKEKLIENIGKPVVIVTHFAPCINSVGEEYKNSSLNPAFVVDMTDLMREYNNIRVWCHGHVHSKHDYLCYSTRIVAEPFGYYTEWGDKSTSGYGKKIKISDIKSMRPWEDILKQKNKS